MLELVKDQKEKTPEEAKAEIIEEVMKTLKASLDNGRGYIFISADGDNKLLINTNVADPARMASVLVEVGSKSLTTYLAQRDMEGVDAHPVTQ